MDVEPLILWIVVLANLAFFLFTLISIIVSLAALFSTPNGLSTVCHKRGSR